MATKIKLSKIEKISLRDCWDNEASDFTPWLASDDNIALLADALGMNELEVKGQEEHVGPFRADILCVDPGTDKFVLIENQLEKTDHNHLGQILTYAQAQQSMQQLLTQQSPVLVENKQQTALTQATLIEQPVNAQPANKTVQAFSLPQAISNLFSTFLTK